MGAQAACEGFQRQIGRLTAIDSTMIIAVSKGADLGRATLHVVEEDDSLVSRSLVLLPVDVFVDRLDDISMGFCSSAYMPPSGVAPAVFLGNLERYLYVHKLLSIGR
ncbi:hypothetical protein ACMD2_26739 [Ananas comosus]|uniref:Uncharacterized protein n=1 Tax=Ananas comosus TaxID=4615 RepID=A0A199V0I2_ANACO|nr:hypothetical protein ACMD2_26739 [Ananas comosus]